MGIQAFGTFETFNNKIFRTNAYLQWGNSKQIIGLIVMLNPGSSRLKSNKNWHSFQSKCETGEHSSVSGELMLDPTMESIHHILSTVLPNLEGRLLIYNLFNLRWGKSKEAIQLYSEMLNDSGSLPFLHSPFPDSENIPWVWTAWSVDGNKVLTTRKNEILKKIETFKRIAVYSTQQNHQTNRNLFCYHPHPLILEKRLWVQNKTITEFKKIYS